MVLDLGNDENVATLGSESLANFAHASSVADEWSEDHVDILLDTERQVGPVLLGHSRQVDRQTWQVDALLAAQQATILNLGINRILVFSGIFNFRKK